MTARIRRAPSPTLLTMALVIVLAGALAGIASGRQTSPPQKEKEQAKQAKITEEIQVVGKAPKEQPISTVTTLDLTQIEKSMPVDLSEAIRYAPGVVVTVGSKYEFALKLRGMDSRRIALLIDGIPSYEPYYGSFDLKTVSAQGIQSFQITKGPSSVLYGPNTLGGIVNVITRRPESEPYLAVNGSFGERKTRSAGLDGGVQWNRFSLSGNVAYQDSDGFSYPGEWSGDKTGWMNTDYRRFNLNGKVLYTPSSDSEFMVNGGVYTSDYGIPPALRIQKAKYWHFKNWDRYTLNAGGFMSLGRNASLRFRAFYVNYKNTLDQWKDLAMTVRQFESSFDNSVYGVFALADVSLTSWNALKMSLNYERDIARIQDDVGKPWAENHQGTLSAAAEDHVILTEAWSVIGGFSLDVIDKFTGGTTTRLNPLLGVKFTPNENLDVHISASQKSRFPNMRALYSPSGGNPDLLSETGTNGEIGFTWTSHGFYVSGSAFLYQFKNLIDTSTGPDGIKRNYNVGQAHINGFELQAQKSLGWLETTVNYTYLDHRNETNDRPLDALSDHTLNFELTVTPVRALSFSVFGLGASKSFWFDTTLNTVLTMPAYFNLDALASYHFVRFDIFLKVTNIFNNFWYSEPVFPARARFLEVGAKIRVF